MVGKLNLDEIGSPEFLDTLYDVLANSYRRGTLQYLSSHPQPVSVHRLAIELAATEHHVTPEDVTEEQRRAASLLLHHVHLPKLHESGALNWERDESLLTQTPVLEQLSLAAPLLDQTPSHHLQSKQ